ncbi:MAG TPA: hypothetical protein VHK27_04565, partial [Gammaproteobacteria bacterium]|nr:hypothetical protein [Gammaproteobacteria bacterium]
MEKRPADTKLQDFFLKMVRQSFWQLGINDATIASYVAEVLAEFARSDNLFRIRGQQGRKVDSMVEMLASKPDEPPNENA